MFRKNKKNIFRTCNAEDIILSDHFFDRWNERVQRITFNDKAELEEYIKTNFDKNKMYHLNGDHYLLDGIMGGIFITADKKNDKIKLITTLGTYNDNPVVYNLIISGEMNSIIKRYGKINLGYAS